MAENFSGNEDDENGSQLTDSATLSPPKAEYGEHYFVASSPSTPRRSSSVGPRRRNEAFSWKHSTPSSLAAPGLENGQSKCSSFLQFCRSQCICHCVTKDVMSVLQRFCLYLVSQEWNPFLPTGVPCTILCEVFVNWPLALWVLCTLK